MDETTIATDARETEIATLTEDSKQNRSRWACSSWNASTRASSTAS
jgi:hypothetical protein